MHWTNGEIAKKEIADEFIQQELKLTFHRCCNNALHQGYFCVYLAGGKRFIETIISEFFKKNSGINEFCRKTYLHTNCSSGYKLSTKYSLQHNAPSKKLCLGKLQRKGKNWELVELCYANHGQNISNIKL